MMDSRYNFWCFWAHKGTPPKFVILDEKKFCVKVSIGEDRFCSHDGNIINRFAHRICKLTICFNVKVKTKGLLDYLKNMQPAQFPYLTSLHLYYVEFDNYSLLQLSPQLEILRLCLIDTNFDVSSVSDEDMCFTKLKELFLEYCNIDDKKILSKCSNILEQLALNSSLGEKLKNYEYKLSALKYLAVDVGDDSQLYGRNLLTKASSSHLRSLFIKAQGCDLSDLLAQPMNIVSLHMEAKNAKNIEGFLNKCPLLQNLKLTDYEFDLKEVKLAYLTSLELKYYYPKCLEGCLKQAAKYSPQLKVLKLSHTMEDFTMDDFPAIPKLDTVWLKEGDETDEEEEEGGEGEELDWEDVDDFNKLFPTDAQVT